VDLKAAFIGLLLDKHFNGSFFNEERLGADFALSEDGCATGVVPLTQDVEHVAKHHVFESTELGHIPNHGHHELKLSVLVLVQSLLQIVLEVEMLHSQLFKSFFVHVPDRRCRDSEDRSCTLQICHEGDLSKVAAILQLINDRKLDASILELHVLLSIVVVCLFLHLFDEFGTPFLEILGLFLETRRDHTAQAALDLAPRSFIVLHRRRPITTTRDCNFLLAAIRVDIRVDGELLDCWSPWRVAHKALASLAFGGINNTAAEVRARCIIGTLAARGFRTLVCTRNL